ncbi:MAG: heparan-alpha-glucosaminide N-acetyltransferase domain-containing protein [Chitinophagaceae bacterium]
MQPTLSAQRKRITSIDILRGLAMVIMALDHTRDFFHVNAFTGNPLDMATTTPALFFTRWITHFCAPIFVFLSGTSIYLQSLRKTKKELSLFLIKRGIWLILVEITIVNFAWRFDPFFHSITLQVIWAIGISMVLLGFIIRLPFKVILLLGLIIVFGHNLLDIPESAEGFKAGFLWDLLHHANFNFYPIVPGVYLLIVYAFLPWTGVMILGYCTGVFFSQQFSAEQRKKIFVRIGWALIVFFFVLRWSNFYGDPVHWSSQKNGLFTFLSILNVNKYPPSLLYLCITIGPSFLLLAYFENVKTWFTEKMIVFGRTAFFYYILHLYVIHLATTICFLARGHSLSDGFNQPSSRINFVLPGEGFSLWIVWLIWLAVVIVLYPLCKRYDTYKRNHREKWWLSYL